MEISNLSKAVSELQSGRYIQTGKPVFDNGICFDPGRTDCISTGASGSGLVTNSSGTYYSATSTVAVPGPNTQYADNIVKAWVVFIGTKTSGGFAEVQSGFNVATVAATAAGKYTVTFKIPFAGANTYSCTCWMMRDPAVSTGGNVTCVPGDTAPTRTAITIMNPRNDQGGFENPAYSSVICVGLQ